MKFNLEFINNKTVESEKQEIEIKIGEIYFSEELEGVLDKENFANEVQKIHREIEKYLGKNENSATYNFRIYSNRKEYENYLRTTFPEKPEKDYIDNDMYFVYEKESSSYYIGKFMKLGLDQDNPKVQEYLKNTGITLSEAENRSKKNYKNNIYPTIGHELTHAHSFFKGIDHRELEDKWGQEMICVFIDQKMWENYIPNFREIKVLPKAKEQVQGKNLYDEIIKDITEGDFQVEEWERLFYPFLENRHGKEKLKNFWSIISEPKCKLSFEQSFEMIFGEKLKDAMVLFQEKIMNA